MPYKNFSPDALAISQSPAYLSYELRQALHEVSKINFAIQSDRVVAKDILNNLTSNYNVVSPIIRFPEGEIFVFLDSADWNKKWQDLQSSLDFKSSEKDPKSKGWPEKSTSDQRLLQNSPPSESWNFDDASMVFRNTLRLMSDQLGRREGLYHRSLFEGKFLLNWIDSNNVYYFKREFSRVARLRQFLINPQNIHSGAWPGLGQVVNLNDLDDDIQFNDDYIYFWGPREHGARTLFTFTIASMTLTNNVPVILGD